ncbi:MAG: hypothetical protein M3Z37_10775 [Candidatus Eremiobacteraeota bacterium]|nr:hypothetical protein [Candidatus Eremiobacteraeota bacterium]
MSTSTSLFEFSEPEGAERWVAKPGRQTAFPLSIRNETQEGQDVAVCVEEPTDWAWATPQRISLDPGDLATVSIIFSPNRETTIAAGEHRAAIRIRDLEGVIFAECTRTFEVEERQELAMAVTLRGPLMSFGLAEGFVLHCNLVNRGNVDVSVTPVGDPHASLTFSRRTVQVPFQGEVSFDIEVRWNASQRANHPDIVTLRVPYRDGEASAAIEWRYIADALDPFMPIYSTPQEDDELISLSWMQQPETHVERRMRHSPLDGDGARQFPAVRDEGGSVVASADAAPDRTTSGAIEQPAAAHANAAPAADRATWQRPAPFFFPGKSRPIQYTYGRRLNPWWPIVQKSAGRWRIKPLPLLLFVIAAEGMVIGMQQSQHDAFESAAGGKIPPITRALRFIPNTAEAIVGYGQHALLVTLHGVHPLRGSAVAAHAAAPLARRAATVRPRKRTAHAQSKHTARAVPTAAPAVRSPARTASHAVAFTGPATVRSFSAHYSKPDAVVIEFVNHGLRDVQLTLADGGTILYRASQLESGTLRIRVPKRWGHPLQAFLVGSAPRGVVMQRRIWIWKPNLRKS